MAQRKKRRATVPDMVVAQRLALAAHALPRGMQTRQLLADLCGVAASSFQLSKAAEILDRTGLFISASQVGVYPRPRTREALGRSVSWAREDIVAARAAVLAQLSEMSERISARAEYKGLEGQVEYTQDKIRQHVRSTATSLLNNVGAREETEDVAAQAAEFANTAANVRAGNG